MAVDRNEFLANEMRTNESNEHEGKVVHCTDKYHQFTLPKKVHRGFPPVVDCFHSPKLVSLSDFNSSQVGRLNADGILSQ